jgi:hypothetical protein
MTLIMYAVKSGASGVGNVDTATKMTEYLIEQGADLSARYCPWSTGRADLLYCPGSLVELTNHIAHAKVELTHSQIRLTVYNVQELATADQTVRLGFYTVHGARQNSLASQARITYEYVHGQINLPSPLDYAYAVFMEPGRSDQLAGLGLSPCRYI